MRPEPHIVTDSDGTRIFEPLVTLGGIHGMSRRVETAVGSYEYVVAECNLGPVEYHEVVVGIEILAHTYIIAIVAVERLLDEYVASDMAQYPVQQRGARLCLAGTQVIVVAAQFLAVQPFLNQLRIIVGIIYHASKHLLFLCHIHDMFIVLPNSRHLIHGNGEADGVICSDRRQSRRATQGRKSWGSARQDCDTAVRVSACTRQE